eukprot:TRINITY_DN13237_c0_g1_i1.p1 TRINITY_DN13237_c0_g1~~TRINITY_DN13237_c0_g1_i1.p1  ORF type:complete len:425 (-),score=130.98 TRINITY_DN13237_c0_g1_i1:119-1393(-)
MSSLKDEEPPLLIEEEQLVNSDDEPPLLINNDDDNIDDDDDEIVPLLIDEENKLKKSVPVTIITGFLGAGKTTLLNYVLTENHGKKIAVIQNEFGEQLGIEEAMIMSQDGIKETEWLELPNGCVCCSVRGDLTLTIEYLVTKQSYFDYIFLECDGLAKPSNVAQAFWIDEELESQIYLDSIVTVVDSKHILQHLDKSKNENEAYEQIAIADVIIINKIDLVTEDHLLRVKKELKQINNFAVFSETTKSKIDLDHILNINAFNLQNAIHIFQEKQIQNNNNNINNEHQHNHEDCNDPNHNHNHNHNDHNSKDDHNHVKTITVSETQPLDDKKLTRWLGTLVWKDEDAANIYRLKGIVHIKDKENCYALQGVHSLFELEPTTILWDDIDQERTSKLVFIGKELDKEQLHKDLLENCLPDLNKSVLF